MNNILLISHDGLASGAKKATELILGQQNNISTLELTADIGVDSFKQELDKKIEELILNDFSLVVISDLKNGTPYNCALSIIANNNLWNKVSLFSGMNLNLILEAAMISDIKMSEKTSDEIIHSAKNGITEMNKTIWDRQINEDEE